MSLSLKFINVIFFLSILNGNELNQSVVEFVLSPCKYCEIFCSIKLFIYNNTVSGSTFTLMLIKLKRMH